MRLTPSYFALALLLLSVPGALSLWPHALRAPGIDSFRYWAIPLAHATDPAKLGSPYRQVDSYTQALARRAALDSTGTLARLSAIALPFDLTASPLLYYLHALAPADYARFRFLLCRLQIAALWLLLAYVAFSCGAHLCVALLFATLTTLGCDPLILDVNVGNTNALQIFVLLAAVVLQARSRSEQLIPQLPLALLLTGSALLKPTLLLPALLLAILHWLGLQRGGRLRWAAALGGTGLALLLLPAVYFGGLGVWGDWLAELTSSDTRLTYPLAAGNLSTTAWLADHLDWPVSAISLAGACLLGAVLAGLLLRRRDLSGRRLSDMRPYLLTGLGIVATLALSPLVWSHYLVLLLLPITWLIFNPVSPALGRWLGVVSLLFAIGGVRRLYLLDIGLPAAVVPLFSMVSWLPTGIGLMYCWHRSGRAPLQP